MKLLKIAVATVLVLGLSSSLSAADSKKMMKPPFGTKADIDFAKDMWQKIFKAGFLGLHGHLYVGGPPHGKVREVIEGVVDNKLVIVKTNYGAKGYR